MREDRIVYQVCLTITRGQCRAEYTSLSAPGAQIVFFSVSLYRGDSDQAEQQSEGKANRIPA
jgi:hypothetical protein